MSVLLQQVVAGLAVGAVYAALALGLVLAHRTTGIVNFAQGAMATLSAYLAWTLARTGLSLWAAIAAAIVVSVVVGAAVERIIVRRFDGAGALATVIVTVGLLICIEGFVSLVWGDEIIRFPALFGTGVVSVAGVRIAATALGTLAVLAGVAIALHVVLLRTRVGLALRAVAVNAESAALAGLPVGPLRMLGWGLAAAVGGLGAVLVAPTLYLQPDMMSGVLVYALAAALLGDFDSPGGAVVGALLLGVLEALAGTYVDVLGNDLRPVLPLGVLAVVLALRPHGFARRTSVERV